MKTQTTAALNYELVFCLTPSLYLLLKPDAPYFTILNASDAYLRATLTQREEIIGKGLFQVFPDNPDDLASASTSNLRKSLESVIRTQLPHKMALQKYDVPIPGEAGTKFEEKYWNPLNTPVMNGKNEMVCILHQVEDVTASIQIQNKLAAENSRAKQEIAEKSLLIKENESRINMLLNALLKYTTMDFSERMTISDKGDELDAIIVGINSLIDELEEHTRLLTQTNEELAYANKELDSFSYSVSHDLRAPLRAINGYSQVLLEDHGALLDESGKYTISVIMRNAAKMGALIDDLLTFSRVGKQNLTKVEQDMDNLVRTVIQDLVTEDLKSRVEINLKPLGSVEADHSMLRQVMANLISNALKYSGKKEKSIIEIGSYMENNNKIFYVKDNGDGFDMTYYNKLFGVFQRLHSNAEFEGTGVGLALVQRIIKKHRGEIWAEAEVGKGATFYFSLPAND